MPRGSDHAIHKTIVKLIHFLKQSQEKWSKQCKVGQWLLESTGLAPTETGKRNDSSLGCLVLPEQPALLS